nr:MAG TPA: hypothetical protein [Caudoviricetes sp.]
MGGAIAEYMDGTRIEKNFLYNKEGNYSRECTRQYELECWLVEQGEKHGGCTFYSVAYMEED